MKIFNTPAINFSAKAPKLNGNKIAQETKDKLHEYKSYAEIIPSVDTFAKEDRKYIDEYIRTKKLMETEVVPTETPATEYIDEASIL